MSRLARHVLVAICLGVLPACNGKGMTQATPTLKADAGGPYGTQFSERTLTFTGVRSTSSPNSIAHYFWNFGDQTPRVDQITPTHVYRKSAKLGTDVTYTITLTIEDTKGNQNSASTTIIITQAYEPTPTTRSLIQ